MALTWFLATTESDTPFLEFCQCACLGAQLEAGSKLGHEAWQMHPTDILIRNWELGKPAATDLYITPPLNYKTLQVICVIPGSAAMQAEKRKHHSRCKMSRVRLSLHSSGDRIL